MNLRSPFRALGTAFRTLTVIRVPGREAESLAYSFPFFPVVGLVLGGGVALIGWALGGRWQAWPAGAAALAVAWMAWITGGLHLDGLADTVDGLSGGRTRERALEIMKDSRIGAMGAIAIALILIVKTVAIARLIELDAWRWLPVPVILSRLAQVQMAVSLPYARAEGGTAERFVKDVRPIAYVLAAIVALVCCLLLAGVSGAAAWLGASLIAMRFGYRMRRRLGGVTGDVLGYASEITETTLFVAIAMGLSFWNEMLWHLHQL